MTTPEQAVTKPAEPSESAAWAEEGEFEAAADLVDKLGKCDTKGAMLGLVLGYRFAIRQAALKPAVAEPTYTIEQIASACFAIQLRDSEFESLCIALQEVEFTDDPVPTYKPGPPLEWEQS